MIVLAASNYDQIVNQISSFYSYVQQAADSQIPVYERRRNRRKLHKRRT